MLEIVPETTFYEQIYIPLTSAYSQMFQFLLINITLHTDILWFTELQKFDRIFVEEVRKWIPYFWGGGGVLYVLEINSFKKNSFKQKEICKAWRRCRGWHGAGMRLGFIQGSLSKSLLG